MNKDIYEKIVRLLALLASIAMLYISAGFSVDGFNIVVPEKESMGIALALIIIVVQVVWNKVGTSAGFTLFLAGLLCYAYGIWTNVLGILVATEITKGAWEILTSGIFGMFLEIVPEPLLVWALIGEATDPVSHLSSPRKKTKTHRTTPRKPLRRW